MWYFQPQKVNYKYDYPEMADYLNRAEDTKALKVLNHYSKKDFFFFCYFVLDIRPINHEWFVPKIYDIQDRHDNTLDLWSRELFKSTLMTFALPIWEVINNPEERVGIFSNTRSLAKDFLRRIKLGLETNKLLQTVFSEVFYDNPSRQSPKWSEDDGLLCKRKSTYREMTFEAAGVTDGTPVGSHYTIRVYDDIVTWESTRTAELINKTRNGFELSHALGARGGTKRVIGTRYDYNDLYSEMLKTDYWIPRIHRGDVYPSFWTEKEVEEKRQVMGTYNFSCQISLSPVSEDQQKFDMKDIKWEERPDADKLNVYIFVDPAGEKKGKSSYTVMWAIGIDSFGGKHVLDIVRDRLNMHEKWEHLRDLVTKHPNVQQIGYEKYSMQADLNYIQQMKIETKTFFRDLTPLGGKVKKEDRIRSLIPGFQRGEWYFPKEYWYTDVEGKSRDLVKEFLEEEYVHFPNVTYMDMLDCLARVHDPDVNIIKPSSTQTTNKVYKLHPDFISSKKSTTTWMGD
jgi:phage terminase large subunit-like protein